jgi:hypothetical protein
MKNKKWILLLLAFSVCVQADVFGQDKIASNVYAWKDASVEKTETGSKRTLVKGSATDFTSMEITAVTLDNGKGEAEIAHTNFEEMMVVRKKRLRTLFSKHFPMHR